MGFVVIKWDVSSCVQVVWIKGHGHKRIIVLKNDMKGKDKSTVWQQELWKRMALALPAFSINIREGVVISSSHGHHVV
jgi:hypothetical protein